MVRHSAFHAVEGFDPAFAVLTDVDFGWRLWLRGYRVRSAGAAPPGVVTAAAPAGRARGGHPLDAGARPRRHEPRRRCVVLTDGHGRPPGGRRPAAGDPAVTGARRRRAAPARPCRRGALGCPRRRTPRRSPRSSAPGVRRTAPGAVAASPSSPPTRWPRGWPGPASVPCRSPGGWPPTTRWCSATTERCELQETGVRGRPGRGEGPARPRAVVRRLPVPGLGDGRARLPRGHRQGGGRRRLRPDAPRAARAGPRRRGGAGPLRRRPQRQHRPQRPAGAGRLHAVRQHQAARPLARASWPGWAASTRSSTTATSRCAPCWRSCPSGWATDRPRRRGHAIRGAIPGIGPDDHVDPLGRRGLQLVRPAHAGAGDRPPPAAAPDRAAPVPRHAAPQPGDPGDAHGRRDPAPGRGARPGRPARVLQPRRGSTSTTDRTTCSTPTSASAPTSTTSRRSSPSAPGSSTTSGPGCRSSPPTATPSPR